MRQFCASTIMVMFLVLSVMVALPAQTGSASDSNQGAAASSKPQNEFVQQLSNTVWTAEYSQPGHTDGFETVSYVLRFASAASSKVPAHLTIFYTKSDQDPHVAKKSIGYFYTNEIQIALLFGPTDQAGILNSPKWKGVEQFEVLGSVKDSSGVNQISFDDVSTQFGGENLMRVDANEIRIEKADPMADIDSRWAGDDLVFSRADTQSPEPYALAITHRGKHYHDRLNTILGTTLQVASAAANDMEGVPAQPESTAPANDSRSQVPVGQQTSGYAELHNTCLILSPKPYGPSKGATAIVSVHNRCGQQVVATIYVQNSKNGAGYCQASVSHLINPYDDFTASDTPSAYCTESNCADVSTVWTVAYESDRRPLPPPNVPESHNCGRSF